MRNTTAVIFLILSVVVAFFNILIGNNQFIIFCFPFFLACVLPGKIGKVIETLTLACTGMYVLVWQSEYTGMVILYASIVWFFVYIHRDIRAKAYIAFLALFIAVASYFADRELVKNLVIHAIMDAAFFGLGSAAMLVTINNLEHTIKRETKPISVKYFDLLDALSKTLHETMDIIKKMQEGATDGRSRKDS
jgi:hypothetical protein